MLDKAETNKETQLFNENQQALASHTGDRLMTRKQ